MRKIVLKIFVVFGVMASVCAMCSAAYADLLITPTRVIFDGRDRYAVVTLVNSGDKPQSYEMGWFFFEMQEEGVAYKTVDEPPGDFDLSKHIVFTPRRVRLMPGAKQKIRLALRRPESIPDGDYHVHLRFAALPEASDSIVQRPSVGADGEVRSGAVVNINVGYSIPVVLSVGENDAKAEIGRLELERNQVSGRLNALVPVVRSGKHSVMGHLFVYHLASDGTEQLVGEISNAHIFPEVDRRVFTVPLSRDISGGSLRIVMRHYDRERELVYDEKTFPLN